MNYTKKVEWCITKATKGLKIIEPDINMALRHIQTAKDNIRACNFVAESEFSKWSIPMIFYSVYHCFLAILSKEGYESENQDCTFAVLATMIEQNVFPLEMEKLQTIMSYDVEGGLRGFRERFQYGVEGAVDKTLLNEMKEMALHIIEVTEEDSKQWR
jgi:uncharacterized protein (UPF0332 family)